MKLNENEKKQLLKILNEKDRNCRTSVIKETEAFKYGMKNFQNNCYINSIVQCLFGCGFLIQKLVETVKSYQPVMRDHHFFHVLAAFYHLIQFNYDGGDTFKKMNIDKIVQALVHCITYQEKSSGRIIFEGNIQQDAYEFLNWFINYLDESVSCLVSLEREIEPEQSIMELFRMNFVQNTTCDSGHVSEYKSFEIVLNLRPPRDEPCKLEDLISQYFDEGIMNSQQGNKYKCNGCNNQLVAARQSILLQNFPQYLIIVLNRFIYEVIKVFSISFFAINSIFAFIHYRMIFHPRIIVVSGIRNC
jgi:ubiquitin C-terminal hydrolase